MDIPVATSAMSNDGVVVSTTPVSSGGLSSDQPQLTRRMGRPPLRGRRPVSNDSTPRRRGRSSSYVTPLSYGDLSQNANIQSPPATSIPHYGSTISSGPADGIDQQRRRMQNDGRLLSRRAGSVTDFSTPTYDSSISDGPSVSANISHTSGLSRSTPPISIASRTIVHSDGNVSHVTEQPHVTRPNRRRRITGPSSSVNVDDVDISNLSQRISPSARNNNRRASVTRSHTSVSSRLTVSYWDCGDATRICTHCQAMVWYEERSQKSRSPFIPKFSLCCSDGKIRLPFLRDPPQLLSDLLDYNGGIRSKVFRTNIKSVNAMFSFTSTGGKFLTTHNTGRGPYTFHLNGHNHHRIGSLLPTHADGRPRFAQLYIYDTENEIDNRLFAVGNCLPATLDQSILRSLVEDLIRMLDEHNALVQAFRMARERFNMSSMQIVKLRLIGQRNRDGRQYNLPTASEVAALIPGDGGPVDSRDVLVEERSTRIVQRISELHPSFMALQYPLLFPYGEDGFHLNIPITTTDSTSIRQNVSLREYYCFRLHFRSNEAHTLHKGGRLFLTYIVDAYSAVLENELNWYKNNQTTIRSDLYNGLADSLQSGERNAAYVGRRVILPSSFTGGPRHMLQQYQDAMAICCWAGIPDIFVTMTCNPKWPEIERHLQQTIPGQTVIDRPDISTRVFKIKLDSLLNDIKKKHHFGDPKAVIYTIEFQKRGLPHCHCLVFLHPRDKLSTTDKIDEFISAELPCAETNPVAFEAVRSHMMHGPCGPLNPSCSCMQNGSCSKGYPKTYCESTFVRSDGWPCYKRSDNGAKVRVGHQDIMLDNRYVVPHNINLLVKYGCHINVEWCNQGSLIKYLFSYLNKGQDRATAVLEGANTRMSYLSMLQNENEIEEYINCRYISASEACWKLFGFPIHYRSVAVERLPFHEEDCQRIYFGDNDDVADVVERTTSMMSKFTAWMRANQLFPDGRTLTYAEFPTKFTWHPKEKEWLPRRGKIAIGRIYSVNPSEGERFYLRMLLNVVRGPCCFKDIRTVDGVEHPSYMSACKALRLLGDDCEWVEAIRQASEWQLGNKLRELFVTILLFCSVSDHRRFFRDCFSYLSEDVLYNQRRLLCNQELVLSEEELLNCTLLYIHNILNGCGKSLSDFPNLPQLNHNLVNISSNRLIAIQRSYNVIHETALFNTLFSGLNVQQKEAYTAITTAVMNRAGGFFFVCGCGGTGKTYLWRTIISSVRSKGKIVLSVASSGIASILLPGGQTSHSMFHLPLNIQKDSGCGIDVNSELAELIRVAELIIWDEAPLQHRYCFEAVDRTLRDICRLNNPRANNIVFGGKVVVLGGDFRQILPVIEHGRRCDIVDSVINKSQSLWNSCTVLCLTTNMRLNDSNLTDDERISMREFNEWLLDMGAGRLPAIALEGEDDATWITIPDDLLIPVTEDPIEAVVSNIYSDVLERMTDFSYLTERCILSPTNDEVDKVNLNILSKMSTEMHEMLSADSICPTSDNFHEMQVMYPTEFLNTLSLTGIPNHKLYLKVGAPVILLRNINLKKGLCNGTRLIVLQVSRTVIQAKIITGPNVGDTVLIGRIDMSTTNSAWPFTFRRRAFPIKVCFAMTINKSQGQTFKHVCAYLPNPVFSHGQLYVVASRVTSRNGLRFYIDNNGKCPNNLTRNVVFKEVFYNIPMHERNTSD